MKFLIKITLICSIVLSFGCPLTNPFLKVEILPDDGKEIVATQEEFESLASRINLPGLNHQLEVKFIILDTDTSAPQLFYINSGKYQDHYSFLTDAAKRTMSMAEFKEKAYFFEGNRELLVGEIVFHQEYRTSEIDGIFTMGFWPTDVISEEYLNLSYNLINKTLSIPGKTLVYHPKGITQEEAVSTQQNSFPVILTEELLKNFSFIPYNTGESYGVLRSSLLDANSISDIVLLESIPNTISHVSGIITTIPQTPLSHVNLIARQNSIPNIYLKSPFVNTEIRDLFDQYIHFKVTADSYTIEAATKADVDQYLEQYRPDHTQIPKINMTNRQIKRLEQISFEESDSYGTKAANLAELGRLLTNDVSPAGFAIPFTYYADFMESNNLFEEARAMTQDSEFQTNLDYRKAALTAFRKKIKNGFLEQSIIDQFESEIRDQYAEGTSLRCRSSTNNEDLLGFNGAGLYNSYTHHLDEGFLAKSIKQVWSGLWTFRAFQERDFYRIDHFEAAMAVLIHPNYKNEQSNGVAVTKNIYDPDYRGFYVNVQLGEDMVTNPQANSIPEEFLISVKGLANSYETEYIRHSNLVPRGIKILSTSHINELTNYMELIQDHFSKKYEAVSDPDFAMEIEFKVTEQGNLIIKQARPWL